MDASEFRKRGKEMIDYVADYLENIRERKPLADVEPGYLQKMIPKEAPQDPEKWDDVFKDIERVVMPGVTHWQNPQFHAYYAANNSFESTIADILSASMACPGFSWPANPACTELEVAMTDWLGKMLQLPKAFLSGGKGGGVINGYASESSFIALLGARSKIINKIKKTHKELTTAEIMEKLVCYCSDQAHSMVERACLLGAVKCQQVESDDKECLRGEALRQQIKKDKENGLIPFFCVATLGTTPVCSFDNLLEIGPVCNEEDIWLHIDAAYAGTAFICPEYRYLLDGVEMADSFDFNPHKLMLVAFDCSVIWYKDTSYLKEAFGVDPLILKHDHQGKILDFRHLEIPLGRRFRSLKVWFVLRSYGVKGIQKHIRKHISLAHEFEDLVKGDDLFQITHEVTMGLVCFRMKGSNELNETLLRNINLDRRIHMVPSQSKGTYFLRFAIGSAKTNSEDIKYAWKVIKELSMQLINEP